MNEQHLTPNESDFGMNVEQNLDKFQSRYNQTFKSIVDLLREEIEVLPTPNEHPAFIGRGSFSQVFSTRFEQKSYAVRFVNPSSNQDISVEDYTRPLIAAQGVSGAEQIVAYSIEDNVTVCETIPGASVASGLPLDYFQKITKEQTGDLIQTISSLYERGLRIDNDGYNTLYDPSTGFYVIDFSLSSYDDEFSDYELSAVLSQTILDITDCFVVSKYSRESNGGTIKTEYLEAGIALLNNFKQHIAIKEAENQAAYRSASRALEERRLFYQRTIDKDTGNLLNCW